MQVLGVGVFGRFASIPTFVTGETKGISEARLGAKGMYVAWSGAKGVVRLIPFNDKAGTVLIGEKEGSGESDGPRVRAEQDLGWRLA